MPSALEQKVVDLIEENRDEVVALLQRLIGFKTITPPFEPVENEDRSAYRDYQAHVRQALDDMGCNTESWEFKPAELEQAPGFGVMPERDLTGLAVVIGRLAGSGAGRSLILNGHYDVVAPGETENWRHDPFGGVVEQGRIYGRGACDMKGGIAAMLKALEFIGRAGIRLAGEVMVQSVPDEEGSLMGTLACCQKGYTADAAIIPEPTNLNTLVAMRGYYAGKITVLGRSGHAEVTHPHWRNGGAVNALTKAVKIVHALEELTQEWRTRPDKQHNLLDPDHVVPTVMHSGEWAISIPEKAEIEFTSNFIPVTQDIVGEIEDKIMRTAATDDWLREHPPTIEGAWVYGAEIEPEEPIAQVTMAAAADLGIASKPSGMGSLTDGVHLINAAKVPTVSFGPAVETAHAANENITIDDLIKTTKVIALAIMRWCGTV